MSIIDTIARGLSNATEHNNTSPDSTTGISQENNDFPGWDPIAIGAGVLGVASMASLLLSRFVWWVNSPPGTPLCSCTQGEEEVNIGYQPLHNNLNVNDQEGETLVVVGGDHQNSFSDIL